jgi:large repetitive protein
MTTRHRSVPRSAFTVAVVALIVANAPSALAAPVLDANCPDGVNQVLSGSAGVTRSAQTFTAETTGALVMGQFKINKAGTAGDYRMDVNATDASGAPTNTTLASTTIPDAVVPPGISTITGTFATPAPVTAGQQYALVLTRPGSTDVTHSARFGDVCSGMEFFSGSQTGEWSAFSDMDMIYSTFVEPAAPQPDPSDSVAPNTQITKGPKDKTKKKTATFEFAGTDTRAVAGFECSLDGAPFATCASPHTVKVKKGRHTFQVRATDQAGNVGAPASDSWKRKKRRR